MTLAGVSFVAAGFLSELIGLAVVISGILTDTEQARGSRSQTIKVGTVRSYARFPSGTVVGGATLSLEEQVSLIENRHRHFHVGGLGLMNNG